MLRGGTIVDATLIAASPSTKNKAAEARSRDASSKKGNQWYFGMKAHVGVDAKSGLVHTAGVTTGRVHDAKVMDHLIREDDRAVYGDKGYASDEKKRAAEDAGVLWAVKEKAKPGRKLTKRQRARNRRFGKVRAKVEHVFRVMKCQFGYRKVRYRGIAKNGAQVFSLLRARQSLSSPAADLRPHEGECALIRAETPHQERQAGKKAKIGIDPTQQSARAVQRFPRYTLHRAKWSGAPLIHRWQQFATQQGKRQA